MYTERLLSIINTPFTIVCNLCDAIESPNLVLVYAEDETISAFVMF